MPLIAVTGGIGAGKSYVCERLRQRGYSVYDSDLEARRIIDTNPEIKARIASEIDSLSVVDGVVDRPRLASIVFEDKAKLLILNSIVHEQVCLDVARWSAARRRTGIVFVETALLYSSGLWREVDGEWRVVAPEAVRIERVCRRNDVSPEQVVARIKSQTRDTSPEHALDLVVTIENDSVADLEAEIDRAFSLTAT